MNTYTIKAYGADYSEPDDPQIHELIYPSGSRYAVVLKDQTMGIFDSKKDAYTLAERFL